VVDHGAPDAVENRGIFFNKIGQSRSLTPLK
jgi:hypothetical protein